MIRTPSFRPSFAALALAALLPALATAAPAGRAAPPVHARTATRAETSAPAAPTDTALAAIHAWAAYDFVPGGKVLFEDTFASDKDGEFPPNWDLTNGAGAVDRVQGAPALVLTEGNYAEARPLVRGEHWLEDPFTIDYDFFDNGGYDPSVFLHTPQHDRKEVHVSYSVSTAGFARDTTADYPGNAAGFASAWHHAALAYRAGQLTCWVDQYRVLALPQCGFVPEAASFGGIASHEQPLVVRNVRIATGAAADPARLLADGRLVTRALAFDSSGTALRPEGMGFLNALAALLQQNADLKLEIDAHGDGAGDAAAALRLTGARAEAVRARLVAMGIDGARLTAKGLGNEKPLGGNATPEERANNRRVELVKL